MIENGNMLLNNVYPRPQLKRDLFLCLNGEWDFSDEGKTEFKEKIRVPFCPESKASGINRRVDGKVLCYRKIVTLPPEMKKKLNENGHFLLHFGAVDQIATVFINDRALIRHQGGYSPFCCDITGELSSESFEVTVMVEDYLETGYLPYGKQKIKRGGMWYTPVTGIWQTVWLEWVPEKYIKRLDIKTCGNTAKIKVFICNDSEGGEQPCPDTKGAVFFSGKYYDIKNEAAEIPVENPEYWTPETPKLYSFTVSVFSDNVSSYFGLRDLKTAVIDGIPRLLLNGKPYFFHGVLDQGYFQDGIFTPDRPEAYEKDIELLKSCGFNMLRKHIKVEPDYFYYLCDKTGIAVFQDMVNNGNYNFIRDTLLPTLGLNLRRSDKNINKDLTTREFFYKSMEETVLQTGNHPCVCCYTVFNEGWGQFEGTKACKKLKELDDTRFVDTASGWFQNVESDVESRHIYFRRVKPVRSKKPFVLSEFGGYTFKVPGHVYNEKRSYGYKTCRTLEEYRKEVAALYERDIIPLVKEGLCADVYTQLSDVEDEINGLVTYDRKVVKADITALREISEKLKL